MSDSPLTSHLQRSPGDDVLGALDSGIDSLHPVEENVLRGLQQDAIAATLDHIPTGEAGEDEEDSVEQYMVEFLKRYKIASAPLQTSAGQGPATLRTLPLETENVSGPKPLPVREPERVTSAPAPRLAQPRELVERTVAPESPADMQALRQLANSSARGALETHSSKNLFISLYTHLLSSVVAMLCCLAFLAMAARFQSVSYVCAVVSLVVSAVFCRRFLALTRQLPSSNRTLTTPR